MTRFVIDAATLVDLVEREIRLDPAHRLVAPGSIRSQALELLLDRVRGGRLRDQDALALHDRITEVKLRLLNDRVSRRVAWDVARAHGGASIRDAEYLALAKLQADALITTDPRLVAAAEGVVRVASAEELSG